VVRLIVRTRDGSEHPIGAAPGLSVMEAIKEQGIDELLAICGGCCSCATCHVHVDSAFVGKFPPMGDEESQLLDGSSAKTRHSRLSCQLTVTEALEGARFSIAPAA
jgi:2Fe-2S ferredoxin